VTSFSLSCEGFQRGGTPGKSRAPIIAINGGNAT
jgi:hypothetical protein